MHTSLEVEEPRKQINSTVIVPKVKQRYALICDAETSQ